MCKLGRGCWQGGGDVYYGKVVLWHPAKEWWFVEYTDGDKETVHSKADLEDMLLYQCETPGCKFWSLKSVVERHEEECGDERCEYCIHTTHAK